MLDKLIGPALLLLAATVAIGWAVKVLLDSDEEMDLDFETLKGREK